MDKDITVLHKILQSTNMRQKVLASNIANADTPGYKAKDVKFGNTLKQQMNMLKTDSKHISTANEGNVNGQIVVDRSPSWGDGNNVKTSAELAKMTENSLRQETAIKLLNTKIKMYRSAIK
ncbi:MAG: flagellar basal body rod protein FlgB [Nitrospira sp.]|nr:flagellar basal body rod protein FlgB [bacterium]MBL7049358.1 flagellar basal body rod protein FlgB [Nitrospira sp.]